MKKIIVVILVFISGMVKAQTPTPTGYLVQSAKWKYVYKIWADSGIYIDGLQKYPNQLQVLCVDSVTKKIGYKYITTSSTIDTTSLSNRINLRVKYTDTSAMLAPYFLSSDSIQWRNRVRYADTAAMLTKYLRKADTLHMTYTSPLIRQGNNLSAPSVLTGLTAGNGIITSGSTIYADTTKIASRRTPIFLTNITTPLIIGGTSTTSNITYKTTTGVGTTGSDHIFQVGNNGATEAMRILNNGKIALGQSTSAYKLLIKSGDGEALRVEESGVRAKISLSGNYGQIRNEIDVFYIENFANSDLIFRTNGGTERMRIFGGGNTTIGSSTSISKLAIPVAPTATSAYGLFSLSNTTTAFNGSTSGYFVGAPAGQYIAVNSVGSVAYNFLQFSKNGSSRFKVDSLGYVKGANLYSNSYTPTLTGVTNVSSSQAYTCQYSRTDSVVTVSGTIGITATSNNARTAIGISLPVASNFTAISNAGGAAYTTGNTTAGHGAGIYADATNDRVELDYYETHGTADIFTFSFTYLIK